MKTAHQVGLTPLDGQDNATRDYVLANVAGELFRWNRVDVSQFSLVDPLTQGWALAYVAASGGVPAHIRITAPSSWTTATGPAFLLISPDLATADHDIIVTHDFFTPQPTTQTIGPLQRYVADDSWIGTQWSFDNVAGPVVTLAVESEDGGAPASVFSDPEILPALVSTDVVRTVATSLRGLHGCGLGRVAGHGLFTGAASLYTDKTAGFGIWGLAWAGTHGNETLRIFDVVVKPSQGGA